MKEDYKNILIASLRFIVSVCVSLSYVGSFLLPAVSLPIVQFLSVVFLSVLFGLLFPFFFRETFRKPFAWDVYCVKLTIIMLYFLSGVLFRHDTGLSFHFADKYLLLRIADGVTLAVILALMVPWNFFMDLKSQASKLLDSASITKPFSFLDSNRNKWFAAILIGLTLAITLYRYRQPELVYPNLSDAFWNYIHARDYPLLSIFGLFSIRPCMYFLMILLLPRSQFFLPQTFHLYQAYDHELRYAIFIWGAVLIWLVPLSGYVAYRLTRSMTAGILTAVMMAFSPMQNMLALDYGAYDLFLIPLIIVFYRIWCVDPGAETRVEQRRAGILTGLMAALTVSTLFHSLYILLPIFPLVLLEKIIIIHGHGKINMGNIWKSVREIIPYVFGLIAGILMPLLFFESVFWINRAGHGLIFHDPDPTGTSSYGGMRSFFWAFFECRKLITGNTAWSLDFFKSRLDGFGYVLLSIFGWYGIVLFIISVIWGIIKPFLRIKECLPFSLPMSVLIGYLLLHTPFLPGYGRMLVGFEFLLFILVSQLVVDVAFALNRIRKAILPIGIVLIFMLTHMMICSYVALDDVYGAGRAAKWLEEHPGKVYFATSAYAYGPQLTLAEAKNVKLQTDENQYLIMIGDNTVEWSSFLQNIQPVRSWRAWHSSLIAWDLIGRKKWTNPSFGHLDIYNLHDIQRFLKDGGEK